jgi:succinate dehydrogenase / fumarate reductase cytochrome b subunit
MSATGIMLFDFLATHLAGNFLLFDSIGGKDAFNNYAHALITNPLIIPMEIGLAAIFIIHIVSAIKVSLASKAARPEAYAVRNTMGKSTFFSRSMLQSGSIIFIFLILHLSTFKFGSEHYVGDLTEAQKSELTAKGMTEEQAEGANTAIQAITGQKEKVRDLYKTVVDNFAKKWYSLVYIFCMVVMGFHLAHGFQSAFQTLGLNHPKYNCCITRISNVLAIIFALGYSVFPIYFGFINPVKQVVGG